MKKNVIITLKVAVLESCDPATVADQVKKGVQFVNPVLQPQIIELSSEQAVNRTVYEVYERSEA